MDNTIWDAAVPITGWDGESSWGPTRYKLLSVPREAIEEGSDEPDAHLLIGIDSSSGIRRVDVQLDRAYGRVNERHELECVRRAVADAPADAAEILNRYL